MTYAVRALILMGILVAWEYLPTVGFVSSRVRFLDPFFVSSPSRVAERVYKMAFAEDGAVLIWPFLWDTVQAMLMGFAAGTTTGFVLGLIFSNSPRIDQVFGIFLRALNSVPREAIIALIVVLVGPGKIASTLAATTTVGFVTFFNAYEGGRSVPASVLQNVRLMGTAAHRVLLQVRLPYVALWTFSVLPNAVAFSLLITITSEFLTGHSGMGALLLGATKNLDSTLTFAVIVFLTAVGVAMVRVAELGKRRLLHWAPSQAES